MIVDTSWTFEDIVTKIKAIKSQYEEILSSFSNFELKERNDYKRETRNQFYNLNMAEWKKDRLWEYMNDCQEYYVLEQICERESYGRVKSKDKTINREKRIGRNM